MKRTLLSLFALLCLTSCANDIGGLTRDQRLRLYELAADASGHPEVGAIIYGTRRVVTAAKNPVSVNP